jgi:hypothetical protein
LLLGISAFSHVVIILKLMLFGFMTGTLNRG